MKRNVVTLVAATAVLGATAIVTGTPSPAVAEQMKAGFLTCEAAAGWGLVFGSTRDLKCVYSAGTGITEHYTGTISKFGIDIGYMNSAVMVWGVMAPSAKVEASGLEGSYGGATASAAVGVGVGANALVGGSDNHIMLQPLSIEGQTGLNVAAGVVALELKAAK